MAVRNRLLVPALMLAGEGSFGGVEPGRRDRGNRLAQSGERQGGHGNQRLVILWVLSSHPGLPPLTSGERIIRLGLEAGPVGGNAL
jgi:hypothetical protein